MMNDALSTGVLRAERGQEKLSIVVFRGAGILAAIYLALFVSFQGGVPALMESGWVLTYLRSTSSSNAQLQAPEATS